MEKDDPRIGRIAQPYITISDDFPGSIIDTAKLYEEDIVFAIKSVLFLLFWASNISGPCERQNIRGFEICKTFYGCFLPSFKSLTQGRQIPLTKLARIKI